MCDRITSEAFEQGLLASSTVLKVINLKEADELANHAGILWGTNALGRSTRARSHLKWQPTRPSLAAEIQEIVRIESERYDKDH